ncbi:MAG TPA: PASTA domain-containing protein, partial [Acidimicrobiales bacterium]|nr:PASTA domain-containing protein [Acidimicrobiales bacterium]
MATFPIADQVGRVLGARYRLLRPLGMGASARVYVAEDVNLRRRVAIKVLHPALAGDSAFLRRFRAEARIVAALRHPNILRVYDWGEDDDSPYLVTELLEGGSLRALLDADHLLSPAQAAKVGADVARALAHAHRRGLVHRDIKPANLLFDDEGRVSVADFGVARALAEASWTEPAGAVLGTARYAAPEQARGQVLDDRADVYSLAVVLVEATTGEVPFVADTTIATLMARLDRPLPVPPSLGPLAPVLAAAGEPQPADRLDATHLAAELDRVAALLPPASALPLVGSGMGATIDLDRDPTLVVAAGDRDPTLAVAGPTMGAGSPTAEASPPSPAATAGEAPPAPAAPAGGRPAVTEGKGARRRWKWAAVGLVALLLAGGGAGAAVIALQPPPLRPVPRLTGDTVSQATGALGRRHLRLAVAGRRYDQVVAAGRVIAQTPAGGQLRQGKAVAVTMSLGPPPVPVPSLAGDTQARATAALGAAHLAVGRVTPQASTTVAQGVVISWSPAGRTVPQGTHVDLVVSSGLPYVTVPTLSGTAASSYAGARSALAGAGLAAAESYAYSTTVPANAVVTTSPGPGASLRLHSTVTVVVSKGPPVLPVPDVTGQSVAAATQTLTADGFSVSGVSGNPTATVTGTNPAIGTVLQKGSSIQLITG